MAEVPTSDSLPRFYRKFLLRFLAFQLVLICCGTALLAATGHWTFLHALFMSVSAVTLSGQSVELLNAQTGPLLLLLVQISAIGYVFASALVLRLSQQGEVAWANAPGQLLRVTALVLLMEAGGSVGLFFLWEDDATLSSFRTQVYQSVFHSVSAFCNAGFSSFPDGMATPGIAQSYLLHLMMAILMFLGALGLPAISDMFSRQKLRERLLNPELTWDKSTRIALFGALTLLLAGSALFLLFENQHALAGQRIVAKGITAVFHVTAATSAGFTSLGLQAMYPATLVLLLVFMLIGGATGSTAGGVQTANLVPVFRPVLLFIAITVLACMLMLGFTEPELPVFSRFFTAVAAFSSSAWNLVPPASFSSGSKVMLMVTMLIGRLGILCLPVVYRMRKTA